MTGLVLNGKAVCCMHMGNFDEAESFLLEALNKASNDFVFLQSLKFKVHFDFKDIIYTVSYMIIVKMIL